MAPNFNDLFPDPAKRTPFNVSPYSVPLPASAYPASPLTVDEAAVADILSSLKKPPTLAQVEGGAAMPTAASYGTAPEFRNPSPWRSDVEDIPNDWRLAKTPEQYFQSVRNYGGPSLGEKIAAHLQDMAGPAGDMLGIADPRGTQERKLIAESMNSASPAWERYLRSFGKGMALVPQMAYVPAPLLFGGAKVGGISADRAGDQYGTFGPAQFVNDIMDKGVENYMFAPPTQDEDSLAARKNLANLLGIGGEIGVGTVMGRSGAGKDVAKTVGQTALDVLKTTGKLTPVNALLGTIDAANEGGTVGLPEIKQTLLETLKHTPETLAMVAGSHVMPPGAPTRFATAELARTIKENVKTRKATPAPRALSADEVKVMGDQLAQAERSVPPEQFELMKEAFQRQTGGLDYDTFSGLVKSGSPLRITPNKPGLLEPNFKPTITVEQGLAGEELSARQTLQEAQRLADEYRMSVSKRSPLAGDDMSVVPTPDTRGKVNRRVIVPDMQVENQPNPSGSPMGQAGAFSHDMLQLGPAPIDSIKSSANFVPESESMIAEQIKLMQDPNDIRSGVFLKHGQPVPPELSDYPILSLPDGKIVYDDAKTSRAKILDANKTGKLPEFILGYGKGTSGLPSVKQGAEVVTAVNPSTGMAIQDVAVVPNSPAKAEAIKRAEEIGEPVVRPVAEAVAERVPEVISPPDQGLPSSTPTTPSQVPSLQIKAPPGPADPATEVAAPKITAPPQKVAPPPAIEVAAPPPEQVETPEPNIGKIGGKVKESIASKLDEHGDGFVKFSRNHKASDAISLSNEMRQSQKRFMDSHVLDAATGEIQPAGDAAESGVDTIKMSDVGSGEGQVTMDKITKAWEEWKEQGGEDSEHNILPMRVFVAGTAADGAMGLLNQIDGPGKLRTNDPKVKTAMMGAYNDSAVKASDVVVLAYSGKSMSDIDIEETQKKIKRSIDPKAKYHAKYILEIDVDDPRAKDILRHFLGKIDSPEVLVPYTKKAISRIQTIKDLVVELGNIRGFKKSTGAVKNEAAEQEEYRGIPSQFRGGKHTIDEMTDMIRSEGLLRPDDSTSDLIGILNTPTVNESNKQRNSQRKKIEELSVQYAGDARSYTSDQGVNFSLKKRTPEGDDLFDAPAKVKTVDGVPPAQDPSVPEEPLRLEPQTEAEMNSERLANIAWEKAQKAEVERAKMEERKMSDKAREAAIKATDDLFGSAGATFSDSKGNQDLPFFSVSKKETGEKYKIYEKDIDGKLEFARVPERQFAEAEEYGWRELNASMTADEKDPLYHQRHAFVIDLAKSRGYDTDHPYAVERIIERGSKEFQDKGIGEYSGYSYVLTDNLELATKHPMTGIYFMPLGYKPPVEIPGTKKGTRSFPIPESDLGKLKAEIPNMNNIDANVNLEERFNPTSSKIDLTLNKTTGKQNEQSQVEELRSGSPADQEGNAHVGSQGKARQMDQGFSGYDIKLKSSGEQIAKEFSDSGMPSSWDHDLRTLSVKIKGKEHKLQHKEYDTSYSKKYFESWMRSLVAQAAGERFVYRGEEFVVPKTDVDVRYHKSRGTKLFKALSEVYVPTGTRSENGLDVDFLRGDAKTVYHEITHELWKLFPDDIKDSVGKIADEEEVAAAMEGKRQDVDMVKIMGVLGKRYGLKTSEYQNKSQAIKFMQVLAKKLGFDTSYIDDMLSPIKMSVTEGKAYNSGKVKRQK